MKGSRLLKALLAAAMLAALTASAQAATYYVDCDSTAASDSHTKEEAQSEANPWKTLWFAGFQAQPGDTVLVKGTNCPDPEDISPIWDHDQAAFLLQDGEAAGRKWTYFKAYPGHRPHIRFRPTKTGIHIQGSYILIEGFEISPDNYNPGEISCCDGNGYSGFGIWITGGHHTVIRNCNIHNCAAAGIGGNWADYITIENNAIWNNSWWSNCGTSGIHLIQLVASDVDFGSTTVNGIDYRIVVANNQIYGNDNRFDTCAPAEVEWPTDGNGIALDDFGSRGTPYEEWKNVLYPHRTLIMNNIIYGNGGRGIQGDAAHADVLHNTLYGNLQNQKLREHAPALGEIGLGGFDMRIFNNIAVAQYNNALWLKYDNPFVGYPVGTQQKIVYGNNLIYGGSTDTDSGATDAGGNIVQDPLLAAPSLDETANFHLKQDSPAINKGSAENSVPDDIDGRTRPIGSLPDIGAYETPPDSAKTVNPASGHAYQRFSTALVWSGAKATCEALGGSLASVTSQAENSWLTSNMADEFGVWLGGTDEAAEGTWIWSTGEPWSWTNWAEGQPDDWDGEDYLQLSSSGTWNDNGGPGSGKDTALPYICEWNGSAPPRNSWLPAVYKLLLKGK